MSRGRPIETDGSVIDTRPTWAQATVVAALIFGFAFAVRLPFCAESFWIDELHTAWSIWAGLGDVAGRAALGNQTPVYYWGLWFWRQAVGDSEVALRCSSVLLSSLACGLISVGVARQTGSLVGGAVAGTLLATDPHAIFFGTELRVFAAILLVATATLWAWSCHRQVATERLAVLVIALVTTAALVQPTSLGVLGWAAIVPAVTLVRGGFMRWSHRGKFALAVVVFGAATLAWWLAGEVVVTAWQHRQQWAAFASARKWQQVETLWRWKSLAIVPAIMGLVAVCVLYVRQRLGSGNQQALQPPPVAAAGQWIFAFLWVAFATSFFWLLSSTGIATVFHRRYMIAALPILAWGAGAAVAHFLAAVLVLAAGLGPISKNGGRRRASLAASVVWVVAGGIGFVINERSAPRPKVLRGEAWRAAATAVQPDRDVGKTVLLSPGLIEAGRFLASGDPAKVRYLAFPLAGPYRVDSVEVFTMQDSPAGLAARIASGELESAILRTSSTMAVGWAERVIAAAPKDGGLAFRHQPCGAIQVIHFDRNPLADLPQ